MPKDESLERVSLRLSKKDVEAVEAYAASKNTNSSDAMRKLIRRGLKYQVLTDTESDISKLIRQNLDSVLKPHINRLANLSAKACMAGGTSKFLLTDVLQLLLEENYHFDAEEMYDSAKHKAYQDLRTSYHEENE